MTIMRKSNKENAADVMTCDAGRAGSQTQTLQSVSASKVHLPARGVVENQSSDSKHAGSRRISCSRSSRVLIGQRMREATLEGVGGGSSNSRRSSSILDRRRRRILNFGSVSSGGTSNEFNDELELDQSRSTHLSSAMIDALKRISEESSSRSLSVLDNEDRYALKDCAGAGGDINCDDNDDDESVSEDETTSRTASGEEPNIIDGDNDNDIGLPLDPAGESEDETDVPSSLSVSFQLPQTPPRSCMLVKTLGESLLHKYPTKNELTDSTRSQTTESTRGMDDSSTSGASPSTCSSALPKVQCKIVIDEDKVTDMSHPRQAEKAVQFSTIEFREYARTLGDNPAVTSGPPISIEWDYDPSTNVTISVDEYEGGKPAPRKKYEIIVPRSVREEWLRDSGFSRMEIEESIKTMNREKRNRHQTVRSINGGRDKLDYTVERIGRRFSRVLLRKPSSKSLYNDWSKSEPKEVQSDHGRGNAQ